MFMAKRGGSVARVVSSFACNTPTTIRNVRRIHVNSLPFHLKQSETHKFGQIIRSRRQIGNQSRIACLCTKPADNAETETKETQKERPEWYSMLTEEEILEYEEHHKKFEYFFEGMTEEERGGIEQIFNDDDPNWEETFFTQEELNELTEARKSQLQEIFVKTEEQKLSTFHEVIDWMADKKEIENTPVPDEMKPVLALVDSLPITLEYKMDLNGEPSPAVPYPKVKLTVELMSLGLSNRETECFIDIVGPRLKNRLDKTRTNQNPGKREKPIVKFVCKAHENYQLNTWGVKKLLYDCIMKAKEIEKSSRGNDDLLNDDDDDEDLSLLKP